MAAAVKTVATGMQRSASSIIILLLSITLLLFLVFRYHITLLEFLQILFRIFSPSRVIHMCEELSLLCAHLCMLPTLYKCEEEDPLDCTATTECKVWLELTVV